MSEYLFSYGTLQPELAPSEIAAAAAELRAVGEGSIAGTLYDLGEFPGAVLNPHSKQKIAGRVFQILDSDRVLPQFDAYEEFNKDSPENSLFLRVKRPVELANGRIVDCWIYVYNGKVDLLKTFKNGKFGKKRLAS